MTYKIGTRVKKVRGLNAGATGVVCGRNHRFLHEYDSEYNMAVRMDSEWVSISDHVFAAGDVCATRSIDWTPIVPDGHRAGQSDLCKPLDHLLSRLKGVAA